MALVTVLLATALIAVLAVGMTSEQQIAIRRTANIVESDQATLLTLGLEEWAIQLLLRDRGATDNLAEDWSGHTNAGAINLRGEYMDFSVLNGRHTQYGLPVSPLVIGTTNGCFYHLTGPDSLFAHGGCPGIREFDVLQPVGNSTSEALYVGGPIGHAVLAQTTQNPYGMDVGVILSENVM